MEFDRPQIFIDELEVFGTVDFKKNVALASAGTKLVEDPEMADPGAGVEKANDGRVWHDDLEIEGAGGQQEEAVGRDSFPAGEEVNRFRFSSNREYYFETDYLDAGRQGRTSPAIASSRSRRTALGRKWAARSRRGRR